MFIYVWFFESSDIYSEFLCQSNVQKLNEICKGLLRNLMTFFKDLKICVILSKRECGSLRDSLCCHVCLCGSFRDLAFSSTFLIILITFNFFIFINILTSFNTRLQFTFSYGQQPALRLIIFQYFSLTLKGPAKMYATHFFLTVKEGSCALLKRL